MQTRRNYCFSHVVPCYRRESVTTGGDPRPRERGEERREEEAVMYWLGCSSTVQVDLTVGSGRGKARQKPRSANTEDGDKVMIFLILTVPIEELRRECNTREQNY